MYVQYKYHECNHVGHSKLSCDECEVPGLLVCSNSHMELVLVLIMLLMIPMLLYNTTAHNTVHCCAAARHPIVDRA
jgi:hypothetical protein